MTLTTRIAYCARLIRLMEAERHGLIAAKAHQPPWPKFSDDPDEHAAYQRGYQEGLDILKTEGA